MWSHVRHLPVGRCVHPRHSSLRTIPWSLTVTVTVAAPIARSSMLLLQPHRACCAHQPLLAAFSNVATPVHTSSASQPASSSTHTSTTVPSTPSSSTAKTSSPSSSPRLRSPRRVSSAQIRAQRPRASPKLVSNPDVALQAPTPPSSSQPQSQSGVLTDACGPEPQPEPEMVSVVNPLTGERLGPRGPEPTRYGDWEGKGRCSDF